MFTLYSRILFALSPPPCLAVIKWFGSLGLKIIKYVVTEIVVPTTLFMHNNGVFEVLTYLLGWMFVVEGVLSANADPTSAVGVYLALTGLLAIFGGVAYSTFLHGI